MIIFYYKKTGEIVGTIGGRVHNREHLKMWVGNKEETDRIVVHWKPTGKKEERVVESIEYEEVGTDDYGNSIYKQIKKRRKVVFREFEPEHPQPAIFRDMEANITAYRNYKVDLKTKKLIKK